MHQKIADLRRRVEKLGVTPAELGIGQELEILEQSTLTQFDHSLYEIIDMSLQEEEARFSEERMLIPRVDVNHGPIHLGTTTAGDSVSVDLAGGESPVFHLMVPGSLGVGKSVFLGHIGVQLREAGYNVVMIDSMRMLSRDPQIREHFEFIDVKAQLHLNPFDPIPSLNRSEQLQIIANSLKEVYGWQYGEREMLEALFEMDYEQLNLSSVLQHLDNKNYAKNWKRAQYRDTCTSTLSFILKAYEPVFNARKGQDLFEILTRGAVVLETGPILLLHQVYLLRLIADHAYMWMRAGRKHSKRVVVVIDEANELLAKGQSFVSKILTIRHSGVHFVFGVQHPSQMPVEIRGACGCYVSFRLTEDYDRWQLGNTINLDRKQREYLSVMPKRHALCYIPNSKWPRAFLLHIPEIKVDPEPSQVEYAIFIDEMEWEPLLEELADDMDDKERDVLTEQFMRECAAEQHRFSKLTQRFERAGIRSAEKQKKIMQRMLSDGLIRTWPLALSRGKPIKLVEPLKRLFDELELNDWRKTNTGYQAQAATEFLSHELKKILGAVVQLEGNLGDKAVDILFRDSNERLHTIEIANSSGHECANGLHCLSFLEVYRHVVVCTSNDMKKHVEKRFKEHGLLKDERVNITTLSRALKMDWE